MNRKKTICNPVEGSMGNDLEKFSVAVQDPTPNVLRLVATAVDLFKIEIRRIDERNIAEAKRLDAIREVDATAVRVAADRALDTQVALAAQVSTFNDAQRALVNTTAELLAKNLQQIQNQIAENAAEAQRQQQLKNDAFMANLASLQKAQNESQGRSGLSIPLLLGLVALVSGIIGSIINGFLK